MTWPSPSAADGPTRAAALLSAGLTLPVLDGLDEIPEPMRAMAIGRINDALQPGGQVLVTCRTRQYRDAIRPPDGPEAALSGAAAIELRPLDAAAVGGYLRDDAPGPVTRARWDPVLKLLGTQAPAGQALSTPLMVALARTIYNPRPGEAPADVRGPAELLGFTERAAVEAHLFDAFVPAAYRPTAPGRWTAGQAERWLAFLARHLEHTISTPDFAWWQLDKAVPRTTRRLVAGLAAGLAVGLAVSLKNGLAAALGFGLGFGLMAGLWAGLWARFGIGFGIAAGIAAGIAFGLAGVLSDIAEAIDPRIVLARDRQAMLLLTLGSGLGVGIGAELGFGLRAGLTAGLTVGLGVGLPVGLAAEMGRTRWTPYLLARGWLAFRHQLPWPLMAFLADAHQRGVLRQAGATYQFRHLELQHRLATRP